MVIVLKLKLWFTKVNTLITKGLVSPSPTSFPALKFYNLTDCLLLKNLKPKIALREGLFVIYLWFPWEVILLTG